MWTFIALWCNGYCTKQVKSYCAKNFPARVISLAAASKQVDLRPSGQFLLYKLPKIFRDTGNWKTDLVIDAIEFTFQSVSNLKLNSLIFSNYKNTATGKPLLVLLPIEWHYYSVQYDLGPFQIQK